MMMDCGEVIRLYTMDEARELFEREQRAAKKKKMKEASYYMKQKLAGATIFFVSVFFSYVSWIFGYGEGSALLFFCPLGLYMMFTRKKVFLIGE